MCSQILMEADFAFSLPAIIPSQLLSFTMFYLFVSSFLPSAHPLRPYYPLKWNTLIILPPSVIGNYIAEVIQTDRRAPSAQARVLVPAQALAREMCVSLSEKSYCMSRSVCLAPSLRFSSHSLSAITVLHSLPLSTGRQTLKSLLIMRETTEKRPKLHTHTHPCMHTHVHGVRTHT